MPWDRYNIHNVQILNLDVLDVIFAFLHNYRDTWSMMQTCRSHYRLGISHLLASSPHPITISNARSIASFRRFMLAGPFSSEKFRAFRSLTIKPSFSDNGDHLHVASDLVRVLNRSTHLEQLVIWDVTRFFGLWPEIQQAAVNSLPRLNLLRLSKVDNKSIDLMKGMISPLRTLTLARPDLQFYAANILPALSNISATLTDLTLTCELRLPEEQVVFHQMRVLRIHDCHLPPTSHVIRTFPNLTELILEEFGGVSGVLDLQAIRLDNQKRIHALASRWTSLSLLKGDMECIYSLGLSCQIDSLEIDTWISKEDLPILLEIFDNFRPRKLNMALSCEELTMVSFRHPFFQRMFDLLSSTCHSLELEIFFDFLLSDISELVDQVVDYLKYFKLDSLRLFLTYRPSGMPDNPIEQYVRTMDLALFASNLAKQLPTLQYVGLSMVPAVSSIVLVGEYRTSPEVWRIFRAGGNSEEAVRLEPVTNDEGEEDQESFMYG